MYKQKRVNIHIRKADEPKALQVHRKVGLGAFVSYALNNLDLTEVVKLIKHKEK